MHCYYHSVMHDFDIDDDESTPVIGIYGYHGITKC